MKQYNVEYAQVKAPLTDCTRIPIILKDETLEERKQKILNRMKQEGFDVLAIYNDVEHSGNFEYLTGLFTRFEEGVLVLRSNGEATLLLGNENLNKATNSRIPAKPIHVPYFSLPNQPMANTSSFIDTIKDCGIREGDQLGVVGWKHFTSSYDDNSQLFDIPYFLLDAFRKLVGQSGSIKNATYLFIGEHGVRVTNNADEIAHYEYGASLVSDAVLNAMNRLEVGIRETELGNELTLDGQHNSVVTIASSGPRFVKANMFPTDNTVRVGDPISLTVGYKGGLSSRAGYAVENETQLPPELQDYISKVVVPYYSAYVCWMQGIRIGTKGGELFQKIEEVLPRSEYHWTLCPGHLTADEEWLSSPIYEGSTETIQSGMLFQIDILPSVTGYGGTNAESTIALADEALRNEIQNQYPALWRRIQDRRNYIINELHIKISEEMLPLCSTVGYLRPFLLNKEAAMRCK